MAVTIFTNLTYCGEQLYYFELHNTEKTSDYKRYPFYCRDFLVWTVYFLLRFCFCKFGPWL
jgi:hypothetical protein